MLVSNMAIYVSMSIHTNFFLLVNVSHVLNLARYWYLFPRTHSSTLALLLLDRSRVIEDTSVCKMRYELWIVSTKVKKRVITIESREPNNSKITSNNIFHLQEKQAVLFRKICNHGTRNEQARLRSKYYRVALYGETLPLCVRVRSA